MACCGGRWASACMATRTMLQNPNVGIGYANTIFYVVVGTVLSIFFSCLGAYTLSRPKLMFKKLFTLLMDIHHIFFRQA